MVLFFVFLFFKDEDSDDEPAVLSLSGMSPAESILDEELLLDQTKDTSTKTEGTEVVTL